MHHTLQSLVEHVIIYCISTQLQLTLISLSLFLFYLLHYILQGYSDEIIGPYLELHYNYAVEKLEMGAGFSHVSTHSCLLAVKEV